MFRAFTTSVCATVRAFAKTRRRGTLQDIYEFAGDLNVWEVLSERVRVKLLPKSKGGYREITRDGPRRTAQRFILRDLFTAVEVERVRLLPPRRGRENAMIRDVCQRIETGTGIGRLPMSSTVSRP